MILIGFVAFLSGGGKVGDPFLDLPKKITYCRIAVNHEKVVFLNVQ